MTSSSKLNAVKFYWFSSKLKLNNVEFKKIDTKEQKANILTKVFMNDVFLTNRKFLCGFWIFF